MGGQGRARVWAPGTHQYPQIAGNVFQEHQTLREKELEMGPEASHGYGGKFGVEQDRMDKSAVGLEYQSKLSKCCLQVDSIWGFGGEFGVQLARVDQVAFHQNVGGSEGHTRANPQCWQVHGPQGTPPRHLTHTGAQSWG